MTEEKFLELQEMGGEYVIAEEFDFDLQRFATADYADDTDDTEEDYSKGKSETKENELANSSAADLINDLLNGDSLKAAVVTSESDTSEPVTLASGGLAVVEPGVSVDLLASAGEDTVVVRDGAQVGLNLKGSKAADKFIVGLGSGKPTRLNLEGYSFVTGAGLVTGETSTAGIRAAMIGGGLTFKNGKMIMKGSVNSSDAGQEADENTLVNATETNSTEGKAEITYNASATDTTSTFISLYTQDEELQKVGFTGNGGGKLDSSKEKGDFVLVGNWDERNYDASTITGGTGDDTALAGGGDTIDLGAGQNQVAFKSTANRDAATVVISQGRTSIHGSNNSLDDEGDIVQAKDFTNANVSYDENGNLVVKGDGYRGTIESLTAENDVVTQKFSDGSNVYKAAIATAAGAAIDAGALGANYFQGNNGDGSYTVVDFSNVDSSVNIDLTGNSSIGSDAATFKNVKAFQAGESDTTLRGSDGNETLSAGVGNATLYGGGGRNVLNGSASNDASDGRTTFMVLGDANGAQNTVTGFQFASDVEDNSLADVIEIDTAQNLVSNVFSKDNNVVMDVTNKNGTATERVVVSDAVGKDMYVTDTLVAQVNTTQATYDGNATFFVVTGKNGAITIDNDNVTQANIWLGNQSTNQFRGDIRTIDARGFDGKAELAGNDLNNTIYGGEGQNSMWGGNGGDDLLIGGSGQNLFFYTNGNGNDTIEGVNDGDVVYLSAVSIENIASKDFGTGSVTLNFNDGGKLIINDEGKNIGVVIGDQTFYVNGDRTDFTTTKE